MSDYARPADVKKIDIGGGLIHRMAKDFRDDSSTRILLGHLDRPLNDQERQIGSSAVFGSGDVLIASNRDYDWRDDSDYLHDYFPLVPQAELASLLTCPIRTDRPGRIMLAEGEAVEKLMLIVSGTVERMVPSGAGGGLTAGSMIGEMDGLAGRPNFYGHRCRSYVKSLPIPVPVLREFLRRNRLADIFLARRWQAFAEQDGEIVQLPAASIRDVPLLRWTSLEIMGRRSAADQLPMQRQRPARRSRR